MENIVVNTAMKMIKVYAQKWRGGDCTSLCPVYAILKKFHLFFKLKYVQIYLHKL